MKDGIIRVLIYKKESELAPKGGPAGYLYNLREGLLSTAHPNVEISFLNGISGNSVTKKRTNIKLIDSMLAALYHRRLYSKIMDDSLPHIEKGVDFKNYDIIHFHSPYELYRVRDSIKDYKGKILLTCHTPIPYHQEVISKFTDIDMKVMDRLVTQLDTIDAFAFERADYLVFPCEYAEEAYIKHWEQYKTIKPQKQYKYVLTGIKPCVARVVSSEIRNKYGIPEDAFVFCYVGRHNEVKGYDDLKKMAEKILAKYSNVWFLIAGKEEPLRRINHERWIEVGWTNDPHSIIAASDTFILPNKETYFDLVMLEVLSLGIPVLATRTGGNKYFEKINDSGIVFYEDVDSGIEACSRIISFNKERVKEMGAANRRLFDGEFTLEHFTKNYIALYQDVAK